MAKRIKVLVTPDLKQTFTATLLGQAIKARRTQSHLRLEDAALLCGVAKQTLINIEHGHPSSQLSSILQVCAGLGIKLRIELWNEGDSDDWH